MEFCSVCQNISEKIFSKRSAVGDSHKYRHHSLADLTAFAKAGCSFCSLILSRIPPDARQHDRPIILSNSVYDCEFYISIAANRQYDSSTGMSYPLPISRVGYSRMPWPWSTCCCNHIAFILKYNRQDSPSR